MLNKKSYKLLKYLYKNEKSKENVDNKFSKDLILFQIKEQNIRYVLGRINESDVMLSIIGYAITSNGEMQIEEHNRKILYFWLPLSISIIAIIFSAIALLSQLGVIKLLK